MLHSNIQEVDIGLAADLGTLQRLPKIAGNDSWVREVCLTARYFSAHEALQFGVVSRTFPSQQQMLTEATKLAQVIAEKSPVAILGTKYTYNIYTGIC